MAATSRMSFRFAGLDDKTDKEILQLLAEAKREDWEALPAEQEGVETIGD